MRDLWETQCEAYLRTLNTQGGDGLESVLGTLDLIGSELNMLRKQVQQYKEENFTLLQQVSNLADLANTH